MSVTKEDESQAHLLTAAVFIKYWVTKPSRSNILGS